MTSLDPSRERTAVAAVATAVVTLPFVHGLAALARSVLGAAPLAGLALTVVPLLALVAAALAGRRGRGVAAGSAVALLGGAWLLASGAHAAAFAVTAVGPLLAPAIGALARRLPDALDGSARRRPVLAGAWLLAGLVAVGQVGRMAAFTTDAELELGVALPGYFDHHMCLASYLQAAEMHAAGEENVYLSEHYPGVVRDAAPTTSVDGMERYLEDPYQYPPQFLLLSKAILAVTNDFGAIRVGWFAGQALLFAAAGLALARFIGGRRGLAAGLALPLVWMSFPTMFNFQYGQFHLAALSLAVLGMLAIERRREALGGTLLGIAVLAKLFPAVLLVPLVVRGRWRALGFVAGSCAVITLVALMALGTAPFEAFFAYHLPRLSSGEAFGFADAWPEFRLELVAANQSPFGLVQKLGELGIALPDGATGVLNTLLSIGILAAAFVAGRRAWSRAGRAQTWLALLGLASLRSPGAWADYVMIAGLWLLSLLVIELATDRRRAPLLATAWGFLFFLPGILPLPVMPPAEVALPLAIAGFGVALGLYGWAAVSPETEPVAKAEWERMPSGTSVTA